ncbi:hypothetical protein [Halobacillus sp. Nhm2S1]|uniref:hypothetical protein n=1 Tax=Halobacillus sp. Nhm2S1 TaxID=2866716 RepID=UPI001C72D1B8|nr:hypothetical protein [Halobacillus sp. Nhm2S1]MBX0357135.1 hypothetical protein [Halobacillus sp. Nhm2S1]
MIEKAACFIFDLDGTWYEDDMAIRNREHLLAIGKEYDMEHDTIVNVDTFTSKIEIVTSWDGDVWCRETIRRADPHKMQ